MYGRAMTNDGVEQLVLTERRGAVLLVTLNRPARLNAWTNAMEDQYFDVLEAADGDAGVRAIVVTGAGRGFCAGADMDDLASASSASDAEIDRPRLRHLPMTLRKPLVGAVNGAAAGLGFVEALYCDVRFASAEAVFLTAFVRRGLAAEYGVSWLLPRIVGHSRGLDLLLSGRRVGGEEAYRMGLVDHLVPAETLVDDAVAYASDLADSCSPWSMATIKHQLALDAERGFDASVADADALMRDSFRGIDIAEGVASFAERRPPVFAPLTTPSTSHKEI
jgi:enoyl-CoA hydratase/carnithine racemase